MRDKIYWNTNLMTDKDGHWMPLNPITEGQRIVIFGVHYKMINGKLIKQSCEIYRDEQGRVVITGFCMMEDLVNFYKGE